MGRKKPEWKCIGDHAFLKDTDVLITDPCYLRHGECGGRSMTWDEREAWAKKRGLVSQTFYGDWGCTVYKATADVGHPYEDKAIGEFCADSGMVCVLGMDDVREKFPKIDDWIAEHDWCATVIKGFCGHVRLMTLTKRRSFKSNEGKRTWYDDTELRVHGVGTVDGVDAAFESVQTSL